MSSQRTPQAQSNQPLRYQIRLQGHLNPQWETWFEGLTITPEENGDTLLSGAVVDQAALHGLLRKVRDLGLPLLEVRRDAAGAPEAADSQSNSDAATNE